MCLKHKNTKTITENSAVIILVFSGYRTKSVGFIGDALSKLLSASPF